MALLAWLLSASALLATVNACGFSYVPATQQVGDLPVNHTFEVKEVQQHVSNQGVLQGASSLKTMWSCVDARGEDPMLGTPGGDFSEFTVGLMAWESFYRVKLTQDDVTDLLAKFINSKSISTTRPFYFHNADRNLRTMFTWLKANHGIDASILPDVAPPNAEAWLEGLALGAHNGCGHVRLMLNGQQDAAGNFAYGERAGILSGYLIKAFYKYYWWTPLDSPQRKRVLNYIQQGPLDTAQGTGNAVVIIDATSASAGSGRKLKQAGDLVAAAAEAEAQALDAAGQSVEAALSGSNYGKPKTSNTCSTVWPLITPSEKGSSVFIYHGSGVAQFREGVIASFFKRLDKANKFKLGDFAAKCNEIATGHLGATLTYLFPANSVGTFTAVFPRT